MRRRAGQSRSAGAEPSRCLKNPPECPAAEALAWATVERDGDWMAVESSAVTTPAAVAVTQITTLGGGLALAPWRWWPVAPIPITSPWAPQMSG
jgi:hypothetical protein